MMLPPICGGTWVKINMNHYSIIHITHNYKLVIFPDPPTLSDRQLGHLPPEVTLKSLLTSRNLYLMLKDEMQNAALQRLLGDAAPWILSRSGAAPKDKGEVAKGNCDGVIRDSSSFIRDSTAKEQGSAIVHDGSGVVRATSTTPTPRHKRGLIARDQARSHNGGGGCRGGGGGIGGGGGGGGGSASGGGGGCGGGAGATGRRSAWEEETQARRENSG